MSQSSTTTSSASSSPSFTTVLEQDHTEINAAARSLRNATTPTSRLSLLNTVTWRLVRHDVSEHLIMRPAFARYLSDEGRRMNEHDRVDHERARVELLDLLDSGLLNEGDEEDGGKKIAEFHRRIDALFGDLAAHMREESGTQLPRLESVLAGEESAELGRRYMRTQVLAPELVLGERRVWDGVEEYARTGLERFEDIWGKVEAEREMEERGEESDRSNSRRNRKEKL